MQTDNELIAEFMGYGKWLGREVWSRPEESKLILLRDFKYHSSWDWLMSVVKKINVLDDQIHFDDQGTKLIITIRKYVGLTNMADAYMHVVEFIKWHNGLKETSINQ